MLICVGATSKTYRSCGSVLNTVKRYFIVMFVRIVSEDCRLHRAFLFEQKSTQIHRNSMYTVTTLACVHPLLECKAVPLFSLPTSERRGCAGSDWSGKRGRAGLETFLQSRTAAHLTPFASPASFAGWERKRGLLCSLIRCSTLKRCGRMCAGYYSAQVFV